MQHYMFYAVHHFTKEEYTEMCMTNLQKVYVLSYNHFLKHKLPKFLQLEES